MPTLRATNARILSVCISFVCTNAALVTASRDDILEEASVAAEAEVPSRGGIWDVFFEGGLHQLDICTYSKNSPTHAGSVAQECAVVDLHGDLIQVNSTALGNNNVVQTASSIAFKRAVVDLHISVGINSVGAYLASIGINSSSLEGIMSEQ
jgi:hypothetical protein